MQMSNSRKWEYKSLYIDRDTYIKGMLGKTFRPEELENDFNELGSEGWELVGVAFNDGAGGDSVVVFKREI